MESNLVLLGIPGIALGLLALLTVGTFHAERRLGSDVPLARRRALLSAGGMGAWMALTGAIASTGVLGRFDVRPPPMTGVFVGTLVLAAVFALSRFGKRLALGLPVGALVAFQAFRLPLELVMHRAAADGLMPSVMSFNGYNFDIVTGVAAALVGSWLLVGRPPRVVLVAFNVLGSVLLLVVSSVAVLALPIFAAFGPEQLNVWVTRFPYVWMAVMVGSALIGHVLLARRLLSDAAPAGGVALGVPG
jgi:hypothetical protein